MHHTTLQFGRRSHQVEFGCLVMPLPETLAFQQLARWKRNAAIRAYETVCSPESLRGHLGPTVVSLTGISSGLRTAICFNVWQMRNLEPRGKEPQCCLFFFVSFLTLPLLLLFFCFFSLSLSLFPSPSPSLSRVKFICQQFSADGKPTPFRADLPSGAVLRDPISLARQSVCQGISFRLLRGTRQIIRLGPETPYVSTLVRVGDVNPSICGSCEWGGCKAGLCKGLW